MQAGIPAVLIYEDLKHLTPYMHTEQDIVGVSLNAPDLFEANARLATASVAVLAGPLGREDSPALFVRGDANADGPVNLSDAITILGHLFLGDPEELACEQGADVDDSGKLELTDAVRILGFLFLGAEPPAPPFPGCGLGEREGGLPCASYAPCR